MKRRERCAALRDLASEIRRWSRGGFVRIGFFVIPSKLTQVLPSSDAPPSLPNIPVGGGLDLPQLLEEVEDDSDGLATLMGFPDIEPLAVNSAR